MQIEALNSCLQSGHTNHAFLLLPTDTSLGVYVFLELHIAEILGHLVAKSLTPEMTVKKRTPVFGESAKAVIIDPDFQSAAAVQRAVEAEQAR